MTRARLHLLAGAVGLASALALAWWGWRTMDAGMLLLGMRLC